MSLNSSLLYSQAEAYFKKGWALWLCHWHWRLFVVLKNIIFAAILIGAVFSARGSLDRNLALSIVVWSYFSSLSLEIAQSIECERFDGTLELGLIMPICATARFLGTGLFAVVIALAQLTVGLAILLSCSVLSGALAPPTLAIIAIGSVAFFALGIAMSAASLLIPKFGIQVGMISLDLLAVFSGVYFPVGMLPAPIELLSSLLPSTQLFAALRSEQTQLATLLTPAICAAISLALSVLIFYLSEERIRSNGSSLRYRSA